MVVLGLKVGGEGVVQWWWYWRRRVKRGQTPVFINKGVDWAWFWAYGKRMGGLGCVLDYVWFWVNNNNKGPVGLWLHKDQICNLVKIEG